MQVAAHLLEDKISSMLHFDFGKALITELSLLDSILYIIFALIMSGVSLLRYSLQS